MRGITRPSEDWPEDAEALPGNVHLPVCPRCGHVGKNPGANTTTYACVGPQGELHKRTRMVMVEYEPAYA